MPRVPTLAAAVAALALPALAQDHPDKILNHHADVSLPLTPEMAATLRPAWERNFDSPVSARPVVIGERVYAAEWMGQVHVLDAATGETIWSRRVTDDIRIDWPWHGFTGTPAFSDRAMFLATVSGDAFALDLETGETLWTADISEDPHGGNVGEMLHWEGVVYIGLASVEEPLSKMVEGFEVDFHGAILALDAATGETIWEQPLALPPADGVPMWTSFAIDPDLGMLYYTTGNNYTSPNTLSDSMIAARLDTGEIVWSRQTTPNDVWTQAEPDGPDYDYTGGAQIFEVTRDGETIPAVGAGEKSGRFHVWDRRTGDPLWSTVIGYPDVGGGIHGEASIGTDRVLLWGNNNYDNADPEQHLMDVGAVDIDTGQYLWVRSEVQPAVLESAGFLAGDVYFVGSLDGIVRGYDAMTGDDVWASDVHGPVASSLWFENDMLIWGTGVPVTFGGAETGFGVVAYRLGE